MPRYSATPRRVSQGVCRAVGVGICAGFLIAFVLVSTASATRGVYAIRPPTGGVSGLLGPNGTLLNQRWVTGRRCRRERRLLGHRIAPPFDADLPRVELLAAPRRREHGHGNELVNGGTPLCR
jgi:hypothetical protein